MKTQFARAGSSFVVFPSPSTGSALTGVLREAQALEGQFVSYERISAMRNRVESALSNAPSDDPLAGELSAYLASLDAVLANGERDGVYRMPRAPDGDIFTRKPTPCGTCG
jgi:hypothetical protein